MISEKFHILTQFQRDKIFPISLIWSSKYLNFTIHYQKKKKNLEEQKNIRSLNTYGFGNQNILGKKRRRRDQRKQNLIVVLLVGLGLLQGLQFPTCESRNQEFQWWIGTTGDELTNFQGEIGSHLAWTTWFTGGKEQTLAPKFAWDWWWWIILLGQALL